MFVLNSSQSRDLDSYASNDYGIDSLILMENAAVAVTDLVVKKYPGKIIHIFCGKGNNGADGLAVARHLYSLGFKVFIYALFSIDDAEGLLKKQLDIVKTVDLPVYYDEGFLDSFPSSENDNFCFKRKDENVVIDALIGTGLNRPLHNLYLKAVQLINRSIFPVISVDIPSGIQGDTGKIFSEAVKSDETVTFGLPKVGNLLYPGFMNQGRLYLSSITIPPDLRARMDSGIQISELPELPHIPGDMYKGSRGHGLIVSGSDKYRGAPLFCSKAFFKSGGGFLHLAVPGNIINSVAAGVPDAVFHALDSDFFTESSTGSIKKMLPGKKWVIIGPGIGIEAKTGKMVKNLLESIDVTLILDGDGISHVCDDPRVLLKVSGDVILTPHPGEAGRLLDRDVKSVLANPMESAIEIAEITESYVILKQPHTVIASPEGLVDINLSGSPALANAGSGDVLNGVLAGMVAMGLSTADACRAAVFIHGLAGELAEEVNGAESNTAENILDLIPGALRIYRKNYSNKDFKFNGRIKEIPF